MSRAAAAGGRARAGGRPAVAFLAWTPVGGRSREIAAALGGEARCFYSLRIVRPAAIPLRYALDGARTIAYLIRARPRAVIVTNPPIFPGVVGLAYARLSRVPLLLDSHPSAFGLAGDRLSRLMLPLHAWVARQAESTLVSAPALADTVRGWGAEADVVHEAPPHWQPEPSSPLRARPQILFAGVFSRDEPVAEVIDAARRVPEVEVLVTGDPRKCPPGLRDAAPPNVRFLGFLPQPDYVRALLDADVVIALSTESTSVMRTAHEAVWAGRPLVVSDWPNLRDVFPHAIHVPNEGAGIAAGVRSAIERRDELVAAAPVARELQQERWRGQYARLCSRLGLTSA
jgi:glycosyltransferase involved in cell wall biosynthesis